MLSQAKVLAQFKEAHGDRYDYSLVKYINSDTKVKIICRDHGAFEQDPNSHKKGSGCAECSYLATGNRCRHTQAEVLAQFKEAHGDRYDYSLVKYVNSYTKVKIICRIHGLFEQAPHGHCKGQGCPSCAMPGFNPALPGIVYYLKVESKQGTAYKIGITNLSVKERFLARDLQNITVLKTWNYSNGQDAYDKEQALLHQYKAYQYQGEDLLESGNTELFSKDVLGWTIPGCELFLNQPDPWLL